VSAIEIGLNDIGVEAASEIADALKLNKAVTIIALGWNQIGDDGASALVDALKVNSSVTNINLEINAIGDEGTFALADALKVNTTVTQIDLIGNEIGESTRASIDALLARNERFRRLILFDGAQRQLLSLMCADECGVVWPYVLKNGVCQLWFGAYNVESIRADFAVVVEERRRRFQVTPDPKRRRLK
jgi:hypothetical protein